MVTEDIEAFGNTQSKLWYSRRQWQSKAFFIFKTSEYSLQQKQKMLVMYPSLSVKAYCWSLRQVLVVAPLYLHFKGSVLIVRC